ncbi:hypothetical protein [Lysinibacillus capsici]|uniref:hypothetical protein n=1 Tax=Lysinibacillus capsici TaxID=2115968 RepID=UPI0028B22BE1|nr:hypothetical protein [Lysinibacillus capsici]
MKKRYRLVPRPRKYDYQTDYPVKFFINVPVKIVNELEQTGLSHKDITKLLQESKIVEKYLEDLLENSRKKD